MSPFNPFGECAAHNILSPILRDPLELRNDDDGDLMTRRVARNTKSQIRTAHITTIKML